MNFRTIVATLFVAIVFLLSWNACAPSVRLVDNSDAKKSIETPNSNGIPAFLIVYVVHGDGDYTYYDPQGAKHKADADAVSEAIKVGESALYGEVVIFHQRRTFNIFKPNSGGKVYHYRFGKKVRRQNYAPIKPGQGWKPEALILQELKSAAPFRFFVYFGHEISEKGVRGYSSTYPTDSFGLADFVEGIKQLSMQASTQAKPFSIMILSSCHSGNKVTISAMEPYANYLVASPALLHLSYLTTLAFSRFQTSRLLVFGEPNIRDLADSISLESFQRLQKNTQTEISVALLNLDASKQFSTESERAALLNEETCVKMYYQPARFGKQSSAHAVKEWGCPIR